MTTLSIQTLLDKIEDDVKEEGSQAALAQRLNVTRQYLNDVIHQRRAPGPQILKAYNITAQRTVSYETREDERNGDTGNS